MMKSQIYLIVEKNMTEILDFVWWKQVASKPESDILQKSYLVFLVVSPLFVLEFTDQF